MTTKRTCTVDGCAKYERAKGLCGMHYERKRKFGDVHYRKPVPDGKCYLWLKETLETRQPSDECWEWPFGTNAGGYGVVRRNGDKKVHRLAAKHAGYDIEGLLVRHMCHNPPCFNPSHLRPGTHADNHRDMVEAGRGVRGTKSASNKITEDQVLAIVDALDAGETHRSIAARFGISYPHVGSINKGRKWGWLTGRGQSNCSDR